MVEVAMEPSAATVFSAKITRFTKKLIRFGKESLHFIFCIEIHSFA